MVTNDPQLDFVQWRARIRLHITSVNWVLIDPGCTGLLCRPPLGQVALMDCET